MHGFASVHSTRLYTAPRDIKEGYLSLLSDTPNIIQAADLTSRLQGLSAYAACSAEIPQISQNGQSRAASERIALLSGLF